MKPEVRIALLSVDHEDIEGYQGALKGVFEQYVVAVDSFNWGNRAPGMHSRFRHHDDDEELTMYVADKDGIAVSMFMEQIMNVITGRPNNDRESRKTFTIAMYEVVPACKGSSVIGRIKLIDQIQFETSAVGRGMMIHPEASPRYELNMLADAEEAGKETYSHLNIRGRGLIANSKTREALGRHAATSIAKPVKPAAVAK